MSWHGGGQEIFETSLFSSYNMPIIISGWVQGNLYMSSLVKEFNVAALLELVS